MPGITTSIFELFKIGPGPSSSHTIGPMKAGYDFMQHVAKLPDEKIAKARTIEVHLYGSLSATGKGHGTDKAVLAGLLGQQPDSCPISFLDTLLQDPAHSYAIPVKDTSLDMNADNIIFDTVQSQFPCSNTLVLRLLGTKKDAPALFEREYYSVGGGFIQWKGWQAPQQGKPVYAYESMEQLKTLLHRHGIRLHKLIMENEKAITGDTPDVVFDKIKYILNTMEASVENGLRTKGVLPGPIGLERKAPSLMEHYKRNPNAPDSFLNALSAFAFAVAEENAAGHCIVTAPTCGASGVLPAVLYAMKHIFKVPEHSIMEGLLASSAVGFLVRHNASMAGAEVGCQGEIGVASSMAAALLTYANGYSFQAVECAAESALEHHLGMTCDPIGGYVQIPCIERNAMGAVKAFTAYLIASAVVPGMHVVTLDQAIQAMAETGKDMLDKYKETSQGGLAVSMVNC